MKKYIIGGFLVVIVVGLLWLGISGAFNGVASDGFSVQTQTIQGLVNTKYASPSELKYLFSMRRIPKLADGESPWKYSNDGGCTCFEWDKDLNLPKGTTACGTGQLAVPDMQISVACPAPNTIFYLQK